MEQSAQAQASAGNETGRYFALVIGIDKYSPPVPQLKTAVADARAIATLLEQQYGFQVTLLPDAQATRSQILDTIAGYQSKLRVEDNLLIYYAGHGFRIEEANKSFWLPVDATSAQSSSRISSDDLTTAMVTLKARHVLVISDSCYSGGLTRELKDLPAISPDEAFLRKTLAMRSRNVMASGRDEPVADNGPQAGHSVFAWAVLRALTDQTDSLFTASTLFYGAIQRAVAGNSEQIPVYLPIRNSGDIGGDFVFHRITATSSQVQTLLSAAATGFDRGATLYRSGDFLGAASAYSQSCPGDSRSCTDLGYMYEGGTGVTKDYAQAVALYRKGCDGGNAVGCSNLGHMYDYGNGVMKDDMQAVLLYRKGCDGGDARGCSDLGTMYEGGTGVTKDYAQAVALYRKGCDGGNAVGCSNLGRMYDYGNGVMKDYAQALALYRKGCDGGSSTGCSYLGYMYENGKGATKDDAQAIALYRMGCDGGDEFGCTNLHRLQGAKQ